MFQGKGVVCRFGYRVAIISTIFGLFAQCNLNAQVFTPPINLSGENNNAAEPQIDVDSQGNVNVVWLDNGGGTAAVFFCRSSDDGQTFSKPLNISNRPGSTAQTERLAVDFAGRIYVVWSENSSGARTILFSRSIDNGVSFSVPQIVSQNSMGTAPAIAIDSVGGINLIWIDKSEGYRTVFFSQSVDHGATFSAPVPLSIVGLSDGVPQLTTGPTGDVYGVWTQPSADQKQMVFFTRDLAPPVSQFSLNARQSTVSNSAIGTQGNLHTIVGNRGTLASDGNTVGSSSDNSLPTTQQEPNGSTNSLPTSQQPRPNTTDHTLSSSSDPAQTSNSANENTATDAANRLVCKNFEDVRCINQTNSARWSGSDIGAWLNSAYLDLPPSGGSIWSACKQNASSYMFSTPIRFDTSGKFVSVRLLGTANEDASGCALNYTPTNSTPAVTLDFSPAWGGGYSSTTGFSDFTLTNNSCAQNGGCGSLATGVLYGHSNGGPGEFERFSNVKIAGFGTAINFKDTNGVSWGTDLDNFSCAYNTKCLNFGTMHENMHWFGGACAVNGICIDMSDSSDGNTSDFYAFGLSMDANTVGYLGAGNFHCFGCHWENNGSKALSYIDSSGGTIEIAGGLALDDQTSGTIPQMFTTGPALASVHGLSVASAGRIITNLFDNSSGGSVVGDFKTYSPSAIQNVCADLSRCYVIRQIDRQTPSAFGALSWIGDSWAFQPTAATALPPLRFNDAIGTNTWALGDKTCTGTVTEDLVLCGTVADSVGQNEALRISATTGQITAGGNIIPSLAGSVIPGHVAVYEDQSHIKDGGVIVATNGGTMTGGSCVTAARAFHSCTSTINLFRPEADTNYAVSCIGIGLHGWPYIMGIVAKTTDSVTIQIGNGSGPAALPSSFNEIDCTVTR